MRLTSRCTEPLSCAAVSGLLDFSEDGFTARARRRCGRWSWSLGVISMKGFIISICSVLILIVALCGLLRVAALTGLQRRMMGSFVIEKNFTFQGPGGSYGFYEHSSVVGKMFGSPSVMTIAGHEFPLPIRITTVAWTTSVYGACFWGCCSIYRRVHKHEQKPQT